VVGAGASASQGSGSLDREWWLRALLVLQRPRPVFAALADDSDEAAGARQEPVTALVFLAGIGSVLATGAAGRLLDNPSDDYDALLIAVWAIVGGGIYGIASYFVFGGVVLGLLRALDSRASYRQARHALGLSAAPIALWLVAVWPIELAVHGRALFRTGGSDSELGGHVFDAIGAGFLLWSLVLLAIAVSALRRRR